MSSYGLRVTNMDSHIFLFSHLSTAIQKDLVIKIKKLGGSCIDSKNSEKNITHLVCGSLKKTEKFFGACVTGKWIVTPEFIIDSYEVGMWLEEENYLFRVENKDSIKDQLAKAAQRWRNQIQYFKIVAFQDWRVALLMNVEKTIVFKRLLRYGGAEIVSLSRPFSRCAKINYIAYVFVDDLHSQCVKELQELGLLCLKEKFLGDYILEDPPPDPFDYIVKNANLDKSQHLSLENQDNCNRGKKSIAGQLCNSSTHKESKCVSDLPHTSSQPCSISVKSCSVQLKDMVQNNVSTKQSTSGELITNGNVKLMSGNTQKRNREVNGGENSVKTADQKCLKLDDEVVTGLSNTKHSSTNKTVSSFDCIGSLVKDSQPLTQCNSTTDSKPVATKKVGSKPKNSEQTITQEKSHSNPKKTRLDNNNSQSVLDDINPNISSMNLTPSTSFQSIPIIIANQKEKNPPKVTNKARSNQSTTNRANQNVTLAPQKRKNNAGQNPVKSIHRKQQTGVNINAAFHKLSRTKHSLPVNIYLYGRVTQTHSFKNAMETVDNVDKNPHLKFNNSSQHSSRCSEMDVCQASTNCPDLSPPTENENEPKSLHFPYSSSEISPIKTSWRGLLSTEKNNSPASSLKLSPSVHLYNISSPKHTSPTPTQTTENDTTAYASKRQLYVNETKRKIASSPDVSNANLNCTSVKSEQRTCMQKEALPKKNIAQLYNSASVEKNITPPSVRMDVFDFFTHESSKLTERERKTDNGTSERQRLEDSNTPTPSTGKTCGKSNASLEKGKPKQSVLHQFFQSLSNSDNLGTGPRHTNNLLLPKQEPCENEAVSNQKRKYQLNIEPHDETGEIIIIPIDDENNQQVLPICKKTQNSSAKHVDNETTCIIDDLNTAKAVGKDQMIAISSSSEKDEKILQIVRNHNKMSNCSVGDCVKPISTNSICVEITDDVNEINGDPHPKENNISGKLLYAKRQPFTTAACSSNGENEHFKNIMEDSCKKRELIDYLEECNLVLGERKNVTHHRIPGADKTSFGSNKKTFDKPQSHSESTEISDDNEENDVSLEQLPHVSWPLSFCSNPVKSDSGEKQFVPAIVSQCMESSRENGFCNTALDHGRATLARMPNVDLLTELIHLLTGDDKMVRNQAFSELISWVMNHPPTTAVMVKVYSDLFQLSTTQTLLCNLLQGLSDTKMLSGGKYLHFLEFTVAVFEMNFSSCLRSKDRKTIKECLLVKWLWSHSQAVHHNNKTREMLRAFESIFYCPQSTSTVIRTMTTLISMVAECFRLTSVHWNTQSRSFLSDTVTSFALDTAKIIRDVCMDKDPFYIISQILSFKPAWFRTMLTASMLSFFNDYLLSQKIQVRDISLQAILSQYIFLLPPLSSQEETTCQKTTLLSSSQNTDGKLSAHCQNNVNRRKEQNLTTSEVNKRNHKGESALHIAAAKGNVEAMKKLLNVPGVDVNLKDNNDWTPLHEACNHGRYDCVELLLKYVPPNTLSDFFAGRDHASSKVDINALAYLNITPLHDAVMNNRVEICQLLLKYGGKRLLETRTVLGNNALQLATTDEMVTVLNGELNNAHHFSSLNQSQDSQLEDSFNLSQSDFMYTSNNNFPVGNMYDHVLNTGECCRSAGYLDSCAFISLITLLLTSYLEATSLMQFKNGHFVKISLLKKNEMSVFRRMKFYLRVFKKHLKRITTSDIFVRLKPQLFTLTAAMIDTNETKR